MRKLFCFFSLWLVAFNLQAMPVSGQDRFIIETMNVFSASGASVSRLYLAEETTESAAPQPESGSLVIPGEKEEGEGKKCMNVCKRWGEDCQINPRTGDRKCRRTCKEFGQECF